MKKLVTLFIAILLSQSLYGLSTDLVLPFNGSTAPAGKFYHPVWKGVKGIFGFSSFISSDEGKKSEVDLLLGFRTNISIFGDVDLYSVFDRYAINTEPSRFRLEKLVLGKKWLYPFNEYLNLGVDLVIAEMFLDGSKQWSVLPRVTPILGVEIVF